MNKKMVSMVLAAALTGVSIFPAAVQAEDSGKVTISILCDLERANVGIGGLDTGFYAALDEWVEAHPEVEISLESMNQTDYQTKITSLGAAGDMPDMFMLKGSWTKNFAENGWVKDITDVLDADPEWKDGYIEGGFDAATYDGKIYGVPRESLATGLVFYNSDLWAEIGYEEFPSTWTELLDAVEKFKEAGITPFVMGNKANWPAESNWLSTLGDRFTGTEWTNSIINGEGAAFTDEEFVAALTCFQELAQAGAFNEDINSLDDVEEDTVYFNKKAATIVTGTWFFATVDSSAPDDVKAATKLALLPSVEGGKGDANTVSGGPAWFFSVSSNEMDETKTELIMDLLKYVSDEHQADVSASAGIITAWANPTYDASGVPALFNDYNELMKTTTVVPIYDAMMDAALIETMNTGLQSLLIGEMTPEELAENIQFEYEMAQ